MREPTMLEIRARYARAIHAEHDRTWQSGAEEFDRWIDGVKAEAWDEGARTVQAATIDEAQAGMDYWLAENPHRKRHDDPE